MTAVTWVYMEVCEAYIFREQNYKRLLGDSYSSNEKCNWPHIENNLGLIPLGEKRFTPLEICRR